MFSKKLTLRVVAVLMTALLVLPTAAQGVFAATDPEITVIVEMDSEPLFSLNSVDQISEDQQQRYSERTQRERDKVLARAEKSVGSLEVKYAYSDVFNGAAVTIRESELKNLERVYGVAKVYEPAKIKLASDDIPDEKLADFNARAKEMIDLASARRQGYEGEGVLVAVIDGGFQTDHENFQKLDGSGNKLSRGDVLDVIQSGTLSTKKATGKAYINSKIPYYYSYALESSNGKPLETEEPDHGTHVAGIAAGNGPTVEGVAPKAQLALMQIAFESTEAYISDVVAAINDAVALGADAMNMSFGENWIGADFEAYEPMTKAIENARSAGVFVAVAAGNEGYLYTETDNPYYGTDCYPSTAPGATAVGAANSDCFASIGNSLFAFGGKAYDVFVAVDGYTSGGDYDMTAPLALGNLRADFTFFFRNNSFVNKFVPVTKSGSRFKVSKMMDQLSQIFALEAAGCLMSRSLYDEIENDLFAHSFFFPMPAVLVLSDADFNAAAAAGTVTVTEGFPDAMAYFSTWGFDRDLQNGVDVSAPGTDVYSSVTDGSYDYYGGTSMASPCVCGAGALMNERINRSGVKLGGAQRVLFIENALKNTAAPYVDETGEYLSPRLQGAGLMNLGAALQNTAALTDALRGGEAELHLGTALGDKFTFSFKLTNRSDADKTYRLSAAFTTDSYDEYESEEAEADDAVVRYVDPETRTALQAVVTGLEKPVAVPAGGSVIVDASVALDPEQTAGLSEIFSNGFYIDGFLIAEGEGETLSLPLTGFYGDYYAVPAVTEIDVSFSVPGDSVQLNIDALTTCSLSRAEAVVTDANGAVCWNHEMTDLSYGDFFSLSFSNEEEPLDNLPEGTYHVTLTVLPAAKNAREQTYEYDFYFPGLHDLNILSWQLIPDGEGYQVRAVSERKDLERVNLTGVTFAARGEYSSAWLDFEEETQEGFVYTGYVFAKNVDDPKANYDVEFYSVTGRTQTFEAPVSDFMRRLVDFVDDLLNFFLMIVLLPFSLFDF